MGLVRNLAKKKDIKVKEGNMYQAHSNMVFYGMYGKSSTAGALSKFTDQPVLFLSPSGTSELVEQEYANIISYPVNDLDELTDVYKDIISDLKTVKKLKLYIDSGNEKGLSDAKKVLKGDYDEMYKIAKEGNYPISAVVVEEASVISNWLQVKLEKDMDINYMGEDKKSLGIDWAKLSRDTVDLYSKFLKLPMTTIISTGYVDPTEKQKIKQVMPDICQGNASRKIIDLVGNVFYFSKTDDGKFMVRLTPSKDIFAKDKLLPIRTDKKLQAEIDLSGEPEKFWKYINSLKEERKNIKK